MGREPVILKDDAELPPEVRHLAAFEGIKVETGHFARAAEQAQVPVEGLHQGAFAGPGAPDEISELPRHQGKGHPREHGDAPVAQGGVVECKYSFRHDSGMGGGAGGRAIRGSG